MRVTSEQLDAQVRSINLLLGYSTEYYDDSGKMSPNHYYISGWHSQVQLEQADPEGLSSQVVICICTKAEMTEKLRYFAKGICTGKKSFENVLRIISSMTENDSSAVEVLGKIKTLIRLKLAE